MKNVELWISVILASWAWGICGLSTVANDTNTSSTTLAYVTRPPLILLTRGLNFFVNRSGGFRRTLSPLSTTSPATTASTSHSFTTRFETEIIRTSSTPSASTTPVTSTSAPATTTSPTTTSQRSSSTTTVKSASTKGLPSIGLEKKASSDTSHNPARSDIGQLSARSDTGHTAARSEDFAFAARSLGTDSVQVVFHKAVGYSGYSINCTDVDGTTPGSHFTNSYIVNNVPFTISSLLPGHLYRLQLLGVSVRKGSSSKDLLASLARTFVATDPAAPRISSHNISVTTNSISILADKDIGALQDYFLITYWEGADSTTGSTKTIRDLNVTDIPEQNTVEFYIGGLSPGIIYDVSIVAFRRSKQGKKWSAVIVTAPLPPANVRIVSSDANEIVLAWDRPLNSGLDSYYVAYHSESHPNASEIDIRDLTLKLDSGIIPGERYFVDIYSVKGGNSFSEPVHLEIATKPLPPTALSVRPDYRTKLFEVSAPLAIGYGSLQDACILQYVPADGVPGETSASPTNVTSIPEDEHCRWFLPLTPGRTYRFDVWTARGKVAVSDPYSNSTAIEPAFDADLLGITLLPAEKTLEIKWNNEALLEYWPAMVGNNGNLTVALTGAYQVTRTVNPISSSSGMKFESLTSGACYTAYVYANVSGLISRNRTSYQMRLDPSGIDTSLANSTATTAMIAFKTDFPPWVLDASCRIIVSVKDDSNHTVVNKTMVTGQSASTNGLADWTLHILVTNLKPFNRYEVTCSHVCGKNGDDCEEKRRTIEPMKFETSQGAPGPVRNIRVEVQTPSVAAIVWEPPGHTNGMIMSYVITVFPDTFNAEEPWNISIPASFSSFTIQNLTGGFKYSFDVRAQTGGGLGSSSHAEGAAKELPTVKMLVWAPPKPYGRPEPLYNTIRSTDFSLRFNLSMFSTRSGLLEGYSVIVTEDDDSSSGSGNGSVGTWFDVQSSDVWPPYSALSKPLPRIKNLESTSVTEVIGVDMDCPKMANKITEQHQSTSPTVMAQFCNGPLRPGRKYRVKLRVYTAPRLFSDSDYSDVVITSAETGTSSGTVVAVILALVVLVAVLTGVVLFLRGRGTDPLRFCVKAKNRLLPVRTDMIDGGIGVQPVIGGGVARRQRSLRERTGVDGRLDNLSSQTGHHHNYHSQLPTVLASANTNVSRPVLKSNFAEHVRLMAADSDFRFSEEYEELKQVGRSEPCTAADVACNRNKNRFTNILPYDHSRVKLVPVDDEEGSDYINASYISGYNSPREYIAAQGPLPSTRDDFWRMVWEQNCPAIVNLTRCIEKGREKCDQYWPSDTDAVYYGDVEVLLMNETRFPDWTVREFKVSHLDQSRTVRHFHFTAWPDFGVPERPQTLVKFVRALRARVPPADDPGPIVVHCSAGVGRSGTLIAIDRLMQHVELHEFVDVYGVVYEMRKERAWMVQTEQQYICIHQCLLCVLEGRENDDSAAMYPFRPVAPHVEIHQNPAFEDDEGIAESGV